MKKSESRSKNSVPGEPDQTKLIPNPTQNHETPLSSMTVLRLLSLQIGCRTLVEGTTRNSVVCTSTIDLFRIVGNGVVVIGSVIATGNIARICITVAKIHSRTTSRRGRLRAGLSLRALFLGLVGRWLGGGSKKEIEPI